MWNKSKKERMELKGQEGEGWKRGTRPMGWAGDRGARGRENSESLCWYTRHWETHWETLTHSRTDTIAHISACFCPPLHRAELTARRPALLKLTAQVTSAIAEPLHRSESVGLTSVTDLRALGSNTVTGVRYLIRWRIRWSSTEEELQKRPSGNKPFSHLSMDVISTELDVVLWDYYKMKSDKSVCVWKL